MKKEYRLLKNQDFKKVLDFKKSVSRENFTIYHKPNELEHCRVGVSVSSKIGNSVVRHKIKRQVVNMLDKCLNTKISIDVIVIVRKKYLDKTYVDNNNNLCEVISKIIERSNRNEKQKKD